jgi:hypothetical protein
MLFIRVQYEEIATTTVVWTGAGNGIRGLYKERAYIRECYIRKLLYCRSETVPCVSLCLGLTHLISSFESIVFFEDEVDVED